MFPPLISVEFIKFLANLCSLWNCTLEIRIERRRRRKKVQSRVRRETHIKWNYHLFFFAITSTSEMQSRRMQIAYKCFSSVSCFCFPDILSQYCTHALNSDDDNTGWNDEKYDMHTVWAPFHLLNNRMLWFDMKNDYVQAVHCRRSIVPHLRRC